MYCNYFNLSRPPFQITPDPQFLFLAPSHREALASVIYGVSQRKGFIVVVGEVGLGKTTVLRAFLNATGDDVIVVYLFNPYLTFSDLLQALCRNLMIEMPGRVMDAVEALQRYLIERYREGKKVVLLLDEAQNIPVATLEQLRMLSNLESDSEKLLQMVFVGQPEFEDLLDRHALRQLRQRIAVKARIRPLTKMESFQYIHHRMAQAGGDASMVFSDGALRRIVTYAGGNPRKLNIACDNCLVTAMGYQDDRVETRTAREILRDLAPVKSFWRLPRLKNAVARLLS